jgi:heme-degrading monooxygenase HmoA
MPYLLIRHKVEDYAKWKPAFDDHAATRRANGSKGGYLLRNADDPNELVLLLQWDDLDRARQFAHSADLQQTMKRAGVLDEPDLHFLDEVEWPSA